MRVDVAGILIQSEQLIDSIAAKSKSRASSAGYRLLQTLPDPTWAETAPGCTIYYGNESGLAAAIEGLRYVALTWLRALIDPSRDWEPTAEWPAPENLIQATRELAQYTPQQLELQQQEFDRDVEELVAEWDD